MRPAISTLEGAPLVRCSSSPESRSSFFPPPPTALTLITLGVLLQLVHRCSGAPDHDIVLNSGQHLLSRGTTNQSDKNAAYNISSSGSQNQSCGKWLSTQHELFQGVQVLCALACLIPHRFFISEVLQRGLFAIAFLLSSIWASVVICSADILGWHLTLTLINLFYTAYLAWQLIPPRFAPELKQLYEKSFLPLTLPGRLFQRLVREGEILTLESEHRYAVEGITMADEKVSILLSGRMQVTCEDVLLHYIEPNEFIDSPEYESCPVGSDKPSQVTITATEPCRYICWQRVKLAEILRMNEFLDNIFYNLIGKDITQKLYALNEFHRIGSNVISLHDQTDWWKQQIPQRSLSVDAVNTEARGKLRSVAWASTLVTPDTQPAPNLIPGPATSKRLSDDMARMPTKSSIRGLPQYTRPMHPLPRILRGTEVKVQANGGGAVCTTLVAPSGTSSTGSTPSPKRSKRRLRKGSTTTVETAL